MRRSESSDIESYDYYDDDDDAVDAGAPWLAYGTDADRFMPTVPRRPHGGRSRREAVRLHVEHEKRRDDALSALDMICRYAFGRDVPGSPYDLEGLVAYVRALPPRSFQANRTRDTYPTVSAGWAPVHYNHPHAPPAGTPLVWIGRVPAIARSTSKGRDRRTAYDRALESAHADGDDPAYAERLASLIDLVVVGWNEDDPAAGDGHSRPSLLAIAPIDVLLEARVDLHGTPAPHHEVYIAPRLDRFPLVAPTL